MSDRTSFVLDLPHGLCVAVRVPGSDELGALYAQLSPVERQHADTLAPLRRCTWTAGRAALRHALARLEVPCGDLMPDHRGAPSMPAGVVGSISHKPALAVAMVAHADGGTLGVDLEQPAPRGRQDISRRVLTAAEQGEIAGLPPDAKIVQIMLRFSLKEAIYKAIDPFVGRYVGFREVSVTPLDSGHTRVTTHLRTGESMRVDARWTRVSSSGPNFGLDDSDAAAYVLTSARALAR